MLRIDLKKDLKHLYRPSKKAVVEVLVPKMNYLMVDGTGDPNSQRFGNAVEALYAVAYTLKFMVKKSELEIDYKVMPLEGLWWADDMSQFSVENKADWNWTAMIMQPDFITEEMFSEACKIVAGKKNPADLSKVRLESLSEGKSAQVMHIGPFSEETPQVQRVHHFIQKRGFERSGKHHEIYLSDIRRAEPKNWQTVIRQPFK